MSKRFFDIIFCLIILILFFWILIICWILAVIDTNTSGFFVQERIGQYGVPFKIFKFRTIKTEPDLEFSSRCGKFLRNFKLDELPQLFNILRGDMSFVGPRPDIAGYYDLLQGSDRVVLKLRPGLTSPASLKYSEEEKILKKTENPLFFNDTIIFPDKIKMNVAYYYNRSLLFDCKIIIQTFISVFIKK